MQLCDILAVENREFVRIFQFIFIVSPHGWMATRDDWWTGGQGGLSGLFGSGWERSQECCLVHACKQRSLDTFMKSRPHLLA